MKSITLLAIALVISGYAFGQTIEDAKLELYNTNDTVARNMLFDVLHGSGADKAEAAYYLGVDYSYLRQNDSARLFLKMAAAEKPESPLAAVARGRLALISGDTVTAETEFAQALKTYVPGMAGIYLEVGAAYDEFTPYYDKAIAILEKGLSLDAPPNFITLMLGSAYAQRGERDHSAADFAKNIEYLENTRRHNSKLTITWLREGGDLIKLTSLDFSQVRSNGALAQVLKLISNGAIADSSLTATLAMPDSIIKNVLLDSAIACLGKAVRVNVKISNAWLLFGNALYKRYHDAAGALEAYKTAKALRDDQYYDACYNMGIVYGELNDAENAVENLNCAFYIKSDSSSIRFLLAQNYAKLNRPDLVEYWLKEGLRQKAPDAADYYLIGTAFGKVGHNLKKAIEYLKKAVALNPNKELYYEDLGVAYGINGQYNEAISTSKKLIALNPNYAPAYINLAISYRNKKDEKMADYYQKKYDELKGAGSNN